MVEKAKGAFLKFIPDVFLTVDHPTGQRCGKSPGTYEIVALCVRARESQPSNRGIVRRFRSLYCG